MFDYKNQILEFIKLNFIPSSPENANFKTSTEGLLAFLFSVFPDGCISDYDLNEILKQLNFVPHTYIIQNELNVGWCLFSEKLQKIKK